MTYLEQLADLENPDADPEVRDMVFGELDDAQRELIAELAGQSYRIKKALTGYAWVYPNGQQSTPLFDAEDVIEHAVKIKEWLAQGPSAEVPEVAEVTGDDPAPAGLIPEIAISRINRDGGTQSRCELNMFHVADLTEAYRKGEDLPAIRLFWDGKEYFLADGFHRVAAAIDAGLLVISCKVENGTHREAVLASLGANAKHGLKRSVADKRNAVTIMFADEEWRTWSNIRIAEVVGVSDTYVGTIRKELETAGQITKQPVRAGKGGAVTDVTAIGKPKEPEPVAPLLPTIEEEEPDEEPIAETDETEAALAEAETAESEPPPVADSLPSNEEGNPATPALELEPEEEAAGSGISEATRDLVIDRSTAEAAANAALNKVAFTVTVEFLAPDGTFDGREAMIVASAPGGLLKTKMLRLKYVGDAFLEAHHMMADFGATVASKAAAPPKPPAAGSIARPAKPKPATKTAAKKTAAKKTAAKKPAPKSTRTKNAK